MWLDSLQAKVILLRMIGTEEIRAGELADLIQKVLAGDEVLFTQGNKLVAKLVPAIEEPVPPRSGLNIRSIKGHRVLTPSISQEEVAADMFRR